MAIYCEHLTSGKVNASAGPAVLSQEGSAIVVDADCGFAHPAIDIGFDKICPAHSVCVPVQCIFCSIFTTLHPFPLDISPINPSCCIECDFP